MARPTILFYCLLFLLSPSILAQSPPTLFLVEETMMSKDETSTIASLQGLLAKGDPSIIFSMRGRNMELLLHDMTSQEVVSLDSSYLDNPMELVYEFQDQIEGYILYGDKPYSSYAATCFAGPLHSIIISESMEDLAIEVGLTLVKDCRTMSMADVWTELKDSVSKQGIVIQPQKSSHFLIDLAVRDNLFYYDVDLEDPLLDKLFTALNPGAVALGWSRYHESELIGMTSSYDIGVIPADWALNLSVLDAIYPSDFDAVDNLKASATETLDTTKDYVAFLMSDGDNLQFILNDLIYQSQYLDNGRTEDYSLSWTIAPSTASYVPFIGAKVKDWHNDAEDMDCIAAPSGWAYVFPEALPSCKTYVEKTTKEMESMGLTIINVIGNDPDCPCIDSLLQHETIEGLVFYWYENYSKGEGMIEFRYGKPIVHGYSNLWGGFNSPSQLARRLNRLAKSEDSPSFSLIPVHVWSYGKEDVKECIGKLDDSMEVVTVSQLFDLILQNALR
ncbi:MAG TPA: hypothetical protein DCF84_02795 [Bacteroidetes bacterium]|nr:hypothetical protein [Bacteroidota bacterium]